MDLIDRIHHTRFLGREFLTWLWYRTELQEEIFRLDDVPPMMISFDDRLVLEAAVENIREINTIRGESPTQTAEARAALRMGKKVVQARLTVGLGTQEWVCVIKADELSVSGIKVPAVLKDAEDDVLMERIHLLDQLEDALDALYREFLRVRMEDALWKPELESIRDWIATAS
jgi:hypothetical protein